MPPLIRIALVALGSVFASTALAEPPCVDQLGVVGARARYATRLFQGKPTRRDVVVSVDLRSTATVAITSAELAVFLGASLEDISQTRPEALPTRSARALEHGGLAFREALTTLIPASATRSVEVRRKALPLDQDLYGVKVVVAGCRRAYAVQEVTLAMPADDPPRWVLVGALAALLAAAFVVLRRLR